MAPKRAVWCGVQEEWNAVSSAALALFAYGQEEASKRGLLLVDTKYEFGKDEQGKPASPCDTTGSAPHALLPVELVLLVGRALFGAALGPLRPARAGPCEWPRLPIPSV